MNKYTNYLRKGKIKIWIFPQLKLIYYFPSMHSVASINGD